MRRVVITGAAGFLGCNLINALNRAGYFVYAVIRPKSIHNERLTDGKQVRKIELDINEISLLTNFIKEKCDGFIHLAWYGARDDFAAQNKNIDCTISALEVAGQLSCQRFIGIGSQAEYGLQAGIMAEDILPNPNTSYGAAKVATCYLTRRRAEQLGIEWIWGRIFSVYGKYEPYGRLIPDLVACLRQRRSPKLTLATQNWDYLYSADAAEAIIALLERGRSGEIYNVANGNIHSLKYFTEQIREQIAPDIAIQYENKVKMIISLQPSVEKIQKDTGWKAKTEFMDGILTMYK